MEKILAIILSLISTTSLFGNNSIALLSPIETDIYISTTGNDNNNGTLENPLKTLEAARNKIRQLKELNSFKTPINVYLRNGTYPLESTFILNNQDSGESDKIITYQAYNDEKPIIIGGLEVNLNWQDQKNGIFAADVSEFLNKYGEFNSLFVNNERAIRARTPNYGSYFNVKNSLSAISSIQIENGIITDYEIKTEGGVTYVMVPDDTPNTSIFNKNSPKIELDLNVSESGFYALEINSFNNNDVAGFIYIKIDDNDPLKIKIGPKDEGASWLTQRITDAIYYSSGKHKIKIFHGSQKIGLNFINLTQKYNAFNFYDGQISNWPNLNDVELVSLLGFSQNRSKIRSVEDNKVDLYTIPSYGTVSYNSDGGHPRYYIENTISALDTPGEWYLDKNAKKLYYRPLSGKNIYQSKFIIPILKELVKINGEKNNPVNFIRFIGLEFNYTDWEWSNDKIIPEPGAGLTINFANNITFIKNKINNIGGDGINLTNSENIQIRGSKILDIGNNGIIFKGSNNVLVAYNNIRETGQIFLDGSGVFGTTSKKSNITRNSISESSFMGIRLTAIASPSEITHNLVFDVLNILHDGGGIYTYKTNIADVFPVVKIENNIVHDILPTNHHKYLVSDYSRIIRGIYLDAMSEKCSVKNNLVYRSYDAIKADLGLANKIENNIFSYTNDGQASFNTTTGKSATSLIKNIFYSQNNQNYIFDFQGKNYTQTIKEQIINNNIYFNSANIYSVKINGITQTYQQWKKESSQDSNFLITDPLFINSENDNFYLKTNSPAFKLGFKEFDLSAVGPTIKFNTYFHSYGGPICNNITDERCINGGDNPSDKAVCLNSNDCVFNGVCYTANSFRDLNNDGKIDGWCMGSDNFKNNWRDCDNSENSCNKGCKAKWAKSGEKISFGEYELNSSFECCGDDANEFYITTNNISACCNNSTDKVNASGQCVPK